MQETKLTIDHKTIREWVEARQGRPARMVGSETPTEDEGVLDIKFENTKFSKNLIEISWNEFFKRFDQCHLAFEFEEFSTDGNLSHFFKFVWRDGE